MKWLVPLLAAVTAACGDRAGDAPLPTDDRPVLAIGWRGAGGFNVEFPRAIRLADSEWREVALPKSMLREYRFTREDSSRPEGGTFRLWRAYFTSADEVWILAIGPGTRGEGGALLRSTNAGRSFADVSHLLPEELRFSPRVAAGTPFAIRFENMTHWWVAAGFKVGPLITGPGLWRTDDGGGTWRLVGGLAESTGVEMFFADTGSAPALLFEGGDSCSRRAGLDEGALLPESLVPCLGQQRDYAETSRRGFLLVPSAAAVWFSDDGTSWSDRPLPVEQGQVASASAVDFADDEQGVACGTVRSGGARSPACWRSNDGGETWRRSALPNDPAVVDIEDVLFSSARHGWTIATAGYDQELNPHPGVRFLRTEDGGATWGITPTAFDEDSRMTGLAAHRPME